MSHDCSDESKALEIAADNENQADGNVSSDHAKNDETLSTSRVEVSIIVLEGISEENGSLSRDSSFRGQADASVSSDHGEKDDTLSADRVKVSIVVLEGISEENGSLSRDASFHEQCRICLQEKEETLLDLGCRCRGGLGKAHRSCIVTWFEMRGSNKCEICQVVAANIPHSPHPGFCISTRGFWCPSLTAISVFICCFLLNFISEKCGFPWLRPGILFGVFIIIGVEIAIGCALAIWYKCFRRRAVERAEIGGNPSDRSIP